MNDTRWVGWSVRSEDGESSYGLFDSQVNAEEVAVKLRSFGHNVQVCERVHRPVGDPPFRPQRTDEVAAWLRVWRERFSERSDNWWLVNDILDDYRLHADAGRPLSEFVPEGRTET